MGSYIRPSVSVFVTSYKTGNEQGFSVGKWFDLSDYEDRQAFINAAAEYCEKELNDPDPELAFPSYESTVYDIGREMITEDSISAELWDLMEMEEHDAQILDAYMSIYGKHNNVAIVDLLERARGSYFGFYDTAEDFAYDYMERHYAEELNAAPSLIVDNINYAHVFEDIRHDYMEYGGHYFHAQ